MSEPGQPDPMPVATHIADRSSVETTEDALLGGQIRLIQPKHGFRAAIDSVLLPAAVTADSGQKIFEIGAGCGAASLCLARRVEGVSISGIEIQPHLVRLAGDNARANGLEGRIDTMLGDVALQLPPRVQGPFDHVMLNPPYLDPARARPPERNDKALALIEGTAGLDIWINRAHSLLRPKGFITLIHSADRLDDILIALDGRFGGITLCPLWPKAGVNAKRLIIRARKGVATPLALTAGLVLHTVKGDYTAEADAILRGAALNF